MMTVLEAIASALVDWLAGWLGGRSAKKAAAAQEAARDAALHTSDILRDAANKQEDENHAANQASLDHLAADARKSPRVQSDDVNQAISAANGDVR